MFFSALQHLLIILLVPFLMTSMQGEWLGAVHYVTVYLTVLIELHARLTTEFLDIFGFMCLFFSFNLFWGGVNICMIPHIKAQTAMQHRWRKVYQNKQ